MNETRQRALSVDIVTDLALAGLRWRGLATRSRAALGINPSALRPGRDDSLDWDRQDYRFCEAAVAKIKAGTTTYLPSRLRDRGVA